MSSHLQKLSLAGVLVSLGIIYGDIGTSPLYVFKAIISGRIIDEHLVLGGISCVFWTLTLQTSFKYVLVTLEADNKGEGGIFSLFSLVRRKAKWLIIPAILGGCALLADGIITPPITVTSAIEGLHYVKGLEEIPVIPIVISIITVMFFIQQFGTDIVGKSFGPIMFLWFSMLGVLGFLQILHNPLVLKALNPYWAYAILFENPEGFLILGAVFLCTTGAEALYSDLGHCGKHNIRVSWIFVKSALVINYLGQGAWLLLNHSGTVVSQNPFYGIMSDEFRIYGIAMATMAAVVASQALISGSFTLISEAVRLGLWPKIRINYPTESKGQLYIPSLNILLWIGCVVVVLFFKESHKMEAAYGLSITIAMLMTTILMFVYLKSKKIFTPAVIAFSSIYVVIEGAFFLGNMEKFMHGGYFAVILAGLLLTIMWTWYRSRVIRSQYQRYIPINDKIQAVEDISNDQSVPRFASQLVYMTSANFDTEVEGAVIYSILQKQPKRADVYWLIHVEVDDEPYKKEYSVVELIPQKFFRVNFKLGFKESHNINILFRKVVEEMVKNNEVNIHSRYESLKKHNIIGDFRFVIIEKILTNQDSLSFWDKMIIKYYLFIRQFTLTEGKEYGLDLSSISVEKVPLIFSTTENINLERVAYKPLIKK